MIQWFSIQSRTIFEESGGQSNKKNNVILFFELGLCTPFQLYYASAKHSLLSFTWFVGPFMVSSCSFSSCSCLVPEKSALDWRVYRLHVNTYRKWDPPPGTKAMQTVSHREGPFTFVCISSCQHWQDWYIFYLFFWFQSSNRFIGLHT